MRPNPPKEIIMSNRIRNIAVPLALALLTTTQAFAATFGSIVYTAPKYPQLHFTCYTRVFFSSTESRLFSRQCDAGEKPGSVKVNYVG